MLKIYQNLKAPLSETNTREWMDEDIFDWEDTNPNFFSTNFLREMKDVIAWSWVSEFRTFTAREIDEFAEQLNWYKVSCYQSMTSEILFKYEDKLYYDMLGSTQKLPEEFVWRHKEQLNWRIMITHQQFSNEFWKKCLNAGVILSPWLRDEVRQKITLNENLKHLKHYNECT